jgi:putative spermidine/putrescine transport system substrate-binding protein
VTVNRGQAVIDIAYWAVAKGSPRAANAWRFISFAITPEPLARFSLKNSYGPMNPDAFKFISDDQAKLLSTYPENFKSAIVLDAEKLVPQLDEMTKRFDQWLTS